MSAIYSSKTSTARTVESSDLSLQPNNTYNKEGHKWDPESL